MAVNQEGHESGCEGMSELGDIPLLQDTEEENVWDSWDVTYRDVLILNSENERVAVYNLTTYSLSVEENYETLRGLLTSTASAD
jgi:hypothetical protein